MPALDGRGLLHGLDNPPPVIVLSAFGYFEAEEVGRRLVGKVTTFIRKPSPRMSCLLRWLALSRGQQASPIA